MRIPFVLVLSASASACTHRLPEISYNPLAFMPAKAIIDSAPKPVAPEIAVATIVGPVLPPVVVKTSKASSPKADVAQANRAALREPIARDYVNAVQVYPYAQNALYRLYTAPGQVSDVVLEVGETLSAISAGDTVRWSVGDTSSGSGPSKQVHVMIKPFAADLKTNLVILTDKHTYHLDLQSTDRVAMAAVSWNYPDQGLIASKQDQMPQTDVPPSIDNNVDLESLKFRYAISGDAPIWRPIRAFDDGHKVYIEFPSQIDQEQAPPLFVVGENGDSELVNYRIRGNYYVVDRLFAVAELRLGADKQQRVRISRTDEPKSRQANTSPVVAGEP
jgi:P-type conjugative transfer protein TrbG